MLALAMTALAMAAPGPVTISGGAWYSDDSGVVHSRVVARDRRSGRRFVLARGRLVVRIRGSDRGSYVGGAWVAGRRVVWVKERVGRRWRVAWLHVVRVGRTVRRLETRRLFRVRPTGSGPPLGAVITSRGELAWLTPDRVVARRPVRRPRVVARGAFEGIALEDDRTLRLTDDDGYAYVDLRPPPGREPDCGGRERLKPVFESAEVIITQASYGDPEEADLSLRACRRADGRDPVVASLFSAFPDGRWLHVAGADRDWVLVVENFCGRGGCSWDVRAAQAGSGRRGPLATFGRTGHPDDDPWYPEESALLAVSDTGLSAWVSEVDGVARLVAIVRDDRYRVLDTGGSLRDLAFSGSVLTWTHDGEPRSADLSPG
jgi:hypothetical protein